MIDFLVFQSNHMNLKNNYYLKEENTFQTLENITISENGINDLNKRETYKNFEFNNISLDDLKQIWKPNINPEEEEYTDNTIKNKKIFNVLSTKRGRKKKGEKSKVHNKHSFDNILAKIQIHFLSFIINLLNDALKAEFGENTSFNFKDLPHKFKKNVKFISFYSINNCMIKDLLKIEISGKYKKFCKNINEIIFNEVCHKSDWLDDFFKLKNFDIFKDYYNKEEPLRKIEYKTKTIILSKKTKTVYDLYEKNPTQKKEISEIINRIYINPFSTKKQINE